MIINSIKRPFGSDNSGHRHNHRKGNRQFYQSDAWKRIVDFVWARDKSTCQMCLEKGIKHELVRGTKDREKQGTVDHKVQRIEFGTDQMDNLWLIGTNHHDSKSAKEKNKMYGKTR